ncbi:N-alpha-acetyltransferase 38, NatC auxiliary subunit [Anopheles maculipalpis]|uniref:N-alpha-acetyltransferase 38, NatC auxiliary subunit n=1 Tax=Anopheles maculipalpis TaxID=1496333 RepID=UPI0021593ACC|nr:N-alpha-acetyltransferase 38, NatC auxiliary subunit [Anopheles maculipalpis]
MKESAKDIQEHPPAGMGETADVSVSEPNKAKYQQALDQAFSRMDIQQKSSNDEYSDDEDRAMQKREMLRSWLNRLFRIKMTDGRILSGYFVCTDADANVVLQGTSEFTEIGGEERILGLVMIPGRYIVSIEERNPPVLW